MCPTSRQHSLRGIPVSGAMRSSAVACKADDFSGMQKSYCKYPVIVVIAIVALVAFSLLWCLFRCCMCGYACCTCCCGGCGGRRNKTQQAANNYPSNMPPPPPPPFARPPPDQVISRQPHPAVDRDEPKYAYFDESDADKLPHMPSPVMSDVKQRVIVESHEMVDVKRTPSPQDKMYSPLPTRPGEVDPVRVQYGIASDRPPGGDSSYFSGAAPQDYPNVAPQGYSNASPQNPFGPNFPLGPSYAGQQQPRNNTRVLTPQNPFPAGGSPTQRGYGDDGSRPLQNQGTGPFQQQMPNQYGSPVSDSYQQPGYGGSTSPYGQQTVAPLSPFKAPGSSTYQQGAGTSQPQYEGRSSPYQEPSSYQPPVHALFQKPTPPLPQAYGDNGGSSSYNQQEAPYQSEALPYPAPVSKSNAYKPKAYQAAAVQPTAAYTQQGPGPKYPYEEPNFDEPNFDNEPPQKLDYPGGSGGYADSPKANQRKPEEWSAL